MSLKLDDARDAFIAMKERVSSLATETAISVVVDPINALKIVGIILGIILIIVGIAIVLHRSRAARIVKPQSRSKRTTRGAK